MSSHVLESPQRYTKKPITIEAMQVTDDNAEAIIRWIEESTGLMGGACLAESGVYIETPEGTMSGLPGWWIIKGIKGEFYPCKPDIFAATYDPENTVTIGDITIGATMSADETLASVVGRSIIQSAQLNG